MDRSFRTPSRTFSRNSSYTDRSHSTLGSIDASNSNISVIARFRPLLGNETLSILNEHTSTQCQIKIADTRSDFTFDQVFGPDSQQQEVFDYCVSTVDDVLAGYNGTILAYGQSGAGKTTTLSGSDASPGLIPRIVDYIWQHKSPSQQCSIAFFEVYKERIKDLFSLQENLGLAESNSGFTVKNLTWHQVQDASHVHEKMLEGNMQRATAATGLNAQSSRSHSLFAIQIVDGDTKGMLYLVDLAGSEKVSKTRATGVVLEEAKSINKSLSALGMVINALTDPRIGHVPYRDSKLTRILQESLGGNSRTTLIINCAPSVDNANETLSTLRFGTRAKAVRNRPILNVDPEHMRMQLLKQELLKWRSGVDVPLDDRVELGGDSVLPLTPSPARPARKLDGLMYQLQTTAQSLRAQNGTILGHNARLVGAVTGAQVRAAQLEKQMQRVYEEIAERDEQVQALMTQLESRIGACYL